MAFNALPVTGAAIMKVLYALEPNSPYVPDFGEISEGIAIAASQDPLFPSRPDGSAWTASILLALAKKESNFHKTVIGDNGRSFGLYQIQPPTANALGRPISINMLTNPRDASYVAIDLIRESMRNCAKRPFEERLSWYASSIRCPDKQEIIFKSFDRLVLANTIMKKHFSEFLESAKDFPAKPAYEPKFKALPQST